MSNSKFLNGEQWDPLESQKRMNKRLMLTADMLNAPVDQVVNGVKQNKPGPAVAPEGGGADKEAAYVFEGILRRIDYDSSAWVAFAKAFECATGGNFGCWAVDLEWSKNDHSFDREIRVREIPNPNESVWFDPAAVKQDRSDAMWAIEVVRYGETNYTALFGKAQWEKAKIQHDSWLTRVSDFVGLSDSSGWWSPTDGLQIGKYWKVTIKMETLRMYTNGVAYWDSEDRPKRDAKGKPVIADPDWPSRDVERRTVKWYLTDGVHILKQGDWNGEYIPLFPVYGRERWVDGKRIITSMIQLAKEAQQAFNYAFTSACEILATVSKTPFLGMVGQFRSKYNQWKTANTELHAFLEYDPVQLSDNTWHTAAPVRPNGEPPIQGILQFCQMCVNAIQRATSVFDPSLGRQKSDQSGKAIEQLQEQSVEGNYHWSENLNIALVHYYKAVLDLVQNEYDAPQVTTILRADGTMEEAYINQEFRSGSDAVGNPVTDHHRIAHGNYSVTVSVGPSAATQRQAAAMRVDGLIKVLPPEMVAQAADLLFKLHDIGPLGDQIADRLVPPAYRDQNDPRAAAAQLAQTMQQNKQLNGIVQKLKNVIATKQPELELRKYVAELQYLEAIQSAQIKAGDNNADRDVEVMEHLTGLAHERASDEAGRIHEVMMNNSQNAHEADMADQQNQDQGESDDNGAS